MFRRKDIRIGDISIPAYMDVDGEYRWSMRQASKAIGYNEGWLSETLHSEGNALGRLQGYGFKGDVVEFQGRGFNKGNLISTEDFMAMTMYAAVVGMRRQAIALLAAALQETLERRADHVFGVARSEDEYIQEFEFRYASTLLNKELRSAIGEWIEVNQGSLQDYESQYSIQGGQRGIYASALGRIYQLFFGGAEPEIDVIQLQRIGQIEDLAAKYIRRKGMNPIGAINSAAEALMIDSEEPHLADRFSRQDVQRALAAK